MESLLFWVLVGIAVVVLLCAGRATSTIVLAAALLAGTTAGWARWSASRTADERARAAVAATLPGARSDGGYVTSQPCRACHPAEYATWHRSFHRTMTQPATAATVRAPFAGETLISPDDGRRYTLGRDDAGMWAEVPGAGRRPVAMMTGSHHMEAFWLTGDRGNALVELPFTYLLDERRWVGRRDVFLVGDEYDKAPSTWNRICIECHVTGGQPRVDAQGGVPASRVAELGIACESCHGPASAHVAANQRPWRRFALHGSGAADATIVNPARLSAARASEVCGQCHGIACPPDGWLADGLGYRPGTSLADTKPILRLASLGDSACRAQIAADHSFAPSRYWRDGTVRVSGREYNGLVESPCFQRGAMSCLSCHSMHDSDPNEQLADARDGNAACTQCHPAIGENVAAHTHHAAGSTGSTCYNCHMPHTTYGLMRAMRSHRIAVPSVQETLATGRPNACNLCHLDRTLAWTAAALARWYGTPAPPLSAEQRTYAWSALDLARGEAGVRALWAWSLGWSAARAASGGERMAPFLIELLGDDYAVIRRIAYQSLVHISGFEDFKFDWIGTAEARFGAQREARERWSRRAQPSTAPELLYGSDGRFQQGELERLMAGRGEDDQMFLAE